MPRHRSLAAKYRRLIVKEYEYWTLLVDPDQAYLGSAYAWLVREGDMQRISRLWAGELVELQLVMRDHESALVKLWQPDDMDYAWLGVQSDDKSGHGQMDFIPRYRTSRTLKLGALDFIDRRWGMDYMPYTSNVVSNRTLFKIRDLLRAEIPGSVRDTT